MKKARTKVSALILALCMLASLIPAMPAVTAQAADGEIVLDFTYSGLNAAGAIASDATVIDNSVNFSAVSIATGNNWEVCADENQKTVTPTSLTSTAVVSQSTYSALVGGDAHDRVYSNHRILGGGYDSSKIVLYTGDVLTFDFVVKTSGYYTMQVETGYLAIADLPVVDATVDGKSLGSFALNAEEDKVSDSTVGVYLDAGITHKLRFKKTSSAGYLNLKYVKFIPAAASSEAFTLNFNNAAANVYKASGNNYTGTLTYADVAMTRNRWGISEKAGSEIKKYVTNSPTNLISDHALLVAGGKGEKYDIAFDFVVEADGTYDISTVMRDYTDFNGVFDVYIDSAEAASFIGRIYNDPNDASKNSTAAPYPVKGLASAELTAGVHTIIFRRDVDDIISTGSYSATGYSSATADRGYMRIHSVTFTPVTEAKADRVVIEVPSTVTVGETIEAKAWVEMSDGSKLTSLGADDYITISAVKKLVNIPGGAELALSEDTVVDGVCSKEITVSDLTDVPLMDYNANYQDVDVADNIVAVGVEAKIDGEIYRAQVQVDVNHAVSDDAVFGGRYAYVTEQPDGTYTVSLIGGLKSIAYVNAGFEVYKGGELVADVTTQSVYKKLSFSDDITPDKTPAYYGVGEDGYIFFAAADKLEAGTYTVVPYVTGTDGKIKHTEVSLTLTLG